MFLNIFKSKFFFNDRKKNQNLVTNQIYCPHPFTNWTLNPNFVKNKESQHTKEGFRKTSDTNTIKRNFDKPLIYCIGGSSTYCTGINSFHNSWPSILNKMFDQNCDVINAGVGGWGTLQSLIRYISWGPFLKPEIILIYQTKNDLNPFLSGRETEKNIFLQYENVMLQYSSVFNTISNFIKYIRPKSDFQNYLGWVYYNNPINRIENIKRLNNEHLNNSESRYQIFANIQSLWGGKVILIPELSFNHTFEKEMFKLNTKMEEVSKNNENTYYFDLQNIYPLNKYHFQDNLHFSEKGSYVFANIVYEILKNKLKKTELKSFN